LTARFFGSLALEMATRRLPTFSAAESKHVFISRLNSLT
jgi:hypothetical protein